MRTRRMFELAQALAVAKSRRDVPAALALMHPEMTLESSFGTRAHGLAENERALTGFFALFPDYEASFASAVIGTPCWQRVEVAGVGAVGEAGMEVVCVRT